MLLNYIVNFIAFTFYNFVSTIKILITKLDGGTRNFMNQTILCPM